jgi:hypothetical protein
MFHFSFHLLLVSLERFTVRFILYLPSVSHIVSHPNPSHMSVSTMSMLPLYSVHTQVFETCFTYLLFHLYLFQSFQYLNRSSRVVYSLVNTLYSLTRITKFFLYFCNSLWNKHLKSRLSNILSKRFKV